MQSPDGLIRLLLLIACLFLTPGVAQESKKNKPCSASQLGDYMDLLQTTIASNWRLLSQYGLVTCTVRIHQNFRGEILHAAIEKCSEPGVTKSVENAAYVSSPLPLPANDQCFERTLVLELVHRPD